MSLYCVVVLYVRQWLHALDTHLASLPATSSAADATLPPPTAPVLLPDLATAQSQLTQQQQQLTKSLQHALDTLRTSSHELIADRTTDSSTSATTPSKRRKTAAQQQAARPEVEAEEASRVVEARAEVDNVLDEVNELLKKERLELKELHTFLTSHPARHDSGAVEAEAAAGGEGGGAVGGGGEVAGKASSAVVGGAMSGGSAGNSQLSSPSSGHSKQVSAGLAKRLNRSAAM